jgi:hypothetical protein
MFYFPEISGTALFVGFPVGESDVADYEHREKLFIKSSKIEVRE